MSDQQQMTDVQDQAGKAMAQALSARVERLDPSIEQRLATARAAALQAAAEAQARTAPEAVLAGAGAPVKTGRGRAWTWALPAALLVLGLLGLQHSQWLQQTLGLADRDAAVLRDDLPPDAYTDPAFREYLDEKTDEETPPPDEEEAKQ